MQHTAAQSTATWAEDRAPQRCDPSAGPGAKTGARATQRVAHSLSGIGIKAKNRRGTTPRNPLQDVLLYSLTPTVRNSNSR